MYSPRPRPLVKYSTAAPNGDEQHAAFPAEADEGRRARPAYRAHLCDDEKRAVDRKNIPGPGTRHRLRLGVRSEQGCFIRDSRQHNIARKAELVILNCQRTWGLLPEMLLFQPNTR